MAFIGRLLPLEAVSSFSGKTWRLIAPRTRRHARAIGHLKMAFPEKSDEECDRIARDMWEVLGRTFGEFFHLPEIAASDRIEASSLNEALTALKGDARAIVCGCHQGNWEIGAMPTARLGIRVTGIYQKITNPFVDRAIHAARAPYYPGGLLPKGTFAGMQSLRNVRSGGCLTLLADVRDGQGVKVPFFGRPAPSTPFPADAARLLDVPLFACFITREPGVRFRVAVERIPVPRTDDRAADVLAATAALHAAFERSIRERPEQWMWAHRRWG